jgi:hypothetical protein
MDPEPQQANHPAATLETLPYATHEPPGPVGAMASASLAVSVAWFFVLFLLLATVFDAPAVFFVGVTGIPIAAIGLGFAARNLAPPASRRGRGVAKAAIILGFTELGLLGMGLLLTPSLGRAREPANRVKCASNLRQIGQAIQMYAQEHAGRLPPGLEHLITDEDLTSEVFVCPSSAGERAQGDTTQEVVKNFLADPIHRSYVYVGAGLTSTTATPAHVLAYEPLGNHLDNPQGIHVLHADGSARWYAAPQAQRLIDELTAGQNPPRATVVKP